MFFYELKEFDHHPDAFKEIVFVDRHGNEYDILRADLKGGRIVLRAGSDHSEKIARDYIQSKGIIAFQSLEPNCTALNDNANDTQ